MISGNSTNTNQYKHQIIWLCSSLYCYETLAPMIKKYTGEYFRRYSEKIVPNENLTFLTFSFDNTILINISHSSYIPNSGVVRLIGHLLVGINYYVVENLKFYIQFLESQILHYCHYFMCVNPNRWRARWKV